MRKISILFIMAFLAFSPFQVMAEKGKDFPAQSRGGFFGPVAGAMAETVDKARELPDDAPVVLTGSIISREASKKHSFIFKDQTGEILVNIKDKAFRGQTISPQDTIRISGKMDKDWGKDPEIDVKHIQILK